MNFWYHGSYTKGDHHEQDREIIRRISSFRTFRNSVLNPFEAVFTGGWFDEVRHLILSIGVWVHGYKPCINSSWVYRYILSIVTYPSQFTNYVNRIKLKSTKLEGHVPQGVEVQVLSSAQKQAQRVGIIETCTDRGGVI